MNVFELFGSIVINNRDAKKSLNDTASHAERTGEKMRKAFKDIGSASMKIGKGVVDVGKSVVKTSTSIVKGMAAAGTAITTGFVASVVSSRDYRTEMAKLDAAFTTNGLSAELAKKTYEDLQAVLGETDQAVEAANHIAKMCDNERQLQKWTDICTGVFATFGDSLPIEGLTEAANETAKTGVVTGSLADALSWAGRDVEAFNEQLKAERTEQGRMIAIMNLLQWLYHDAAEQYKDNAAGVMEANRATEKWNSAMAALGEVGEPILTGVKNWIADLVLVAVPHIENLITNFENMENVWTEAIWPLIQDVAKVKFGVDLPDWNTVILDIQNGWKNVAWVKIQEFFKAKFTVDLPPWDTFVTDVQTWWGNVKTNMDGITKWVMQIPDMPHESAEQLAAAVSGWWTNTAVPALDSVSTWSLKLFGHPVEDEAAITAHVAAWWKVAGDAVTDACNWTLRLFGMPAEDANTITTTVNTWWGTVVDQVESACTWTARFVGFGEWTKEDDAALRVFWDGVYNKIVEICHWKISLPELPTAEEAQQLVNSIISWWDGVKSQIKLTFGITPQVEAAYGAFQSDLSAAGGGGTVSNALTNSFTSNSDSFIDWGSVMGGFFSHASGLENVPHDGYKARLHKGEAVLTSAQASEWRGGGGNIEALLSQIVANTGAGKSIVLDSGVLVGQLAPGMDGALGTIMGRKRRGN